jgi:inorganic triphosphatase YgiF
VEIELKLRVATADLPVLRRRLLALGRPTHQLVDNAYFDTDDWRLARARAGLRLRRIDRADGPVWLQTFKTQALPGVMSARGEWEQPVADARLNLAALASTPLSALLGAEASLLAHSLHAVFRTVFRRSRAVVDWGGGQIEYALDIGSIDASGLQEPICELELELLGGEPGSLVSLARHLMEGPEPGRSRCLALMIDGHSKALRGYRLAGHRGVALVEAGAIEAATTPLSARNGLNAAIDAVIGAVAPNRMPLGDLDRALDRIGQLARWQAVSRRQRAALLFTLAFWRRRLRTLAMAEAQAQAIQGPYPRQALPDACETSAQGGRRARLRSTQRQCYRARAKLSRALESPAWAQFVLDLLAWQIADYPHRSAAPEQSAGLKVPD